MRFDEYFRHVYVLNLPERHDRRREVARELKRAGLCPDEGKSAFFPAIRPQAAAGFPSIGAHGCFLSHLAILQRARSEGARNVLVIEDDLAIHPEFLDMSGPLTQLLEGLDWGMAYFGHVVPLTEDEPVRLEPAQGELVTAHFYAVNGPVIPKLEEFLRQVLLRPPGDPLGGPMHVDGAYNMFREQNPELKVFLAAPNLGWQRPSRSDIAHGRWFDRLPVVRDVATLAREAKARLDRARRR